MPGIYIHVPFCIRKCRYCDFVSVPVTEGAVPVFVDALLREIDLASETLPERRYDTVFFGGGTPSLLGPEQIERILSKLFRRFSVKSDSEISMECNPGTLTMESMRGYRDAGINRVSIGLQSADDSLLERIGRIHMFSDYLMSADAVSKAGIRNVSVDIMHGLPGQTQSQYLDTIRKAADSGVTHISSYCLMLEEGTPLYDDVVNGRETLPDEDAVADMQDSGIDLLDSLGFSRYEISNFAREGYECRHNLNYWHNGEYAGFGPAAHSAMRLSGWTRWSNIEDTSAYVGLLSEGTLPVFKREEIPVREEMFETVMTGLRLTEGIPADAFCRRFGSDPGTAYRKAVKKALDEGLLDREAYRKGVLKATEEGLDLLNRVLGIFLDENDPE